MSVAVFDPRLALPFPIRYRAIGQSPQFSNGTLRNAVSQAFSLWAEETSLAFIQSSFTPSPTTSMSSFITVEFLPFSPNENGVLGNALIAINTNVKWRYGEQVANSYDLVGTIAHEIGHRLGLEHSSDPTSIMFPSQQQSRSIRSLPAADIRAISDLRGPPNVVLRASTHGTTVMIEDPGNIKSVARRGSGTSIEAKGKSAWFHFAPPTLSLKDGEMFRLHAVWLKLRTEERIRLTRVDIWDGDKFRQAHVLDMRGSGESSLWNLRLGVAEKPIIRDAVNISLNLDYFNAGSHRSQFISAAVECVSRNSVFEDPVLAPPGLAAIDNTLPVARLRILKKGEAVCVEEG